jgi:hypothetical protein
MLIVTPLESNNRVGPAAENDDARQRRRHGRFHSIDCRLLWGHTVVVREVTRDDSCTCDKSESARSGANSLTCNKRHQGVRSEKVDRQVQMLIVLAILGLAALTLVVSQVRN